MMIRSHSHLSKLTDFIQERGGSARTSADVFDYRIVNPRYTYCLNFKDASHQYLYLVAGYRKLINIVPRRPDFLDVYLRHHDLVEHALNILHRMNPSKSKLIEQLMMMKIFVDEKSFESKKENKFLQSLHKALDCLPVTVSKSHDVADMIFTLRPTSDVERERNPAWLFDSLMANEPLPSHDYRNGQLWEELPHNKFQQRGNLKFYLGYLEDKEEIGRYREIVEELGGSVSKYKEDADYVVSDHCNIDCMGHIWKVEEYEQPRYVTPHFLLECDKVGFFFRPVLVKHCIFRTVACLRPMLLRQKVCIHFHGGAKQDREALYELLGQLELKYSKKFDEQGREQQIRDKVTHVICLNYSKPDKLPSEIEAVSLGWLQNLIQKGFKEDSSQYVIVDKD